MSSPNKPLTKGPTSPNTDVCLQVSLLTIAGASFMGTHGVAERFMDSLAKVGVNVTWNFRIGFNRCDPGSFWDFGGELDVGLWKSRFGVCDVFLWGGCFFWVRGEEYAVCIF